MSHAGHEHVQPPRSEGARRALLIVLAANGGFLLVEIVGGLALGSLALLADAAHMAADVAGLVIALIALSLAARPASPRRSFGLRRAEALGGLANGLLVIGAAIWIIVEAVSRFGDPPDVAGGALLVIATLGLLVNVVSAFVLARARGRDLNLRGAFVHMVADALSSIAVIVAAIGIIAFGAEWLDPVASILIAVLVIGAAWGLMRDTLNVLVEGAPRHLDPAVIERALTDAPHVAAVHHLHVWEIGADMPALSAHVVLDDVTTLHEAQVEGTALKALLAERFDIHHATLELECHDCDAPEHDGAGPGPSAAPNS